MSNRLAWSIPMAWLALWGQVTLDDGNTDLPPACAPAPAPQVTPQPNVGTFHLCGADPQVARAIEQLLAGRSFSTSLSARGDGCADLTVRATGDAAASGSATTNLSVSLGSGRSLTIQIVSERGATRASIGEA